MSSAFLPSERELTTKEFRERIIAELQGLFPSAKDEQKQKMQDALDAFLYQHLPLISSEDYKVALGQMLSGYSADAIENVLEPLERWARGMG